jgi:hypothetical protein
LSASNLLQRFDGVSNLTENGLVSKKRSHYSTAGLVFEELEPRLLLSADPLAVATDVDAEAVQQVVLDHHETLDDTDQSGFDLASDAVRNELVIIDARAELPAVVQRPDQGATARSNPSYRGAGCSSRWY